MSSGGFAPTAAPYVQEIPVMQLRPGLAAIALTAALVPVAARAAIFEFSLAVDAATVSGTITTDGTVGVLAASNVADFSLEVADATNSFTLTPGNSTVLLFGTAFSASLDGLFFDHSAPDDSFFGITDVAFENGFCVDSGGECVGSGGAKKNIIVADVLYQTPAIGRTKIGTPIPEPAGAALLAATLLGVVAVRRRQSRRMDWSVGASPSR